MHLSFSCFCALLLLVIKSWRNLWAWCWKQSTVQYSCPKRRMTRCELKFCNRLPPALQSKGNRFLSPEYSPSTPLPFFFRRKIRVNAFVPLTCCKNFLNAPRAEAWMSLIKNYSAKLLSNNMKQRRELFRKGRMPWLQKGEVRMWAARSNERFKDLNFSWKERHHSLILMKMRIRVDAYGAM